MKATKRNRDFAELIDNLTDLSQRDFREAIKIAKQFRKAQRSLQRAIARQQHERLPRTSNQQVNLGGLDYEFAE